ncbi:MAG: glycosyltransferase family 4 protein [Candidatus Promineifilaceae bacterium]
MRILQLVHQYLPDHVGGTELYTVWLSRALQQQGHEVAVFHRRSAEGSGLARREEDGIVIWSAWNGRFQPTDRLLSTLHNGPLLAAFNEVVATIQPDLVHVQHLMGLPASILQQVHKRNIPYVITLHDYWWVCANSQLLTNDSQEICHGPKAFLNCARCALARANQPLFPPALPLVAVPLALRNKLLRDCVEKAAAFIAPANFVKQWYVSQGIAANKIHVLPWGVDYPPRPELPAPIHFRVGYIGGLSRQKGVHVLVEAFNQLPETAELWLAGDLEFDPGYVKQLKAAGRATFLGKLNRQDVWQMLAQVDVIVVPSLWYETFVFVISEAFAMGVPVIASDLGVVGERVRHGVDGLLVAPGDVDQLAHAMQTLHDDPALRARLRQNIAPIPTVAEHGTAVAHRYQTITKEYQSSSAKKVT